MSWQFGDITLYSFYEGQDNYPVGTDKYKVTRQRDAFILDVKDLDPGDGGIYSCHTVDSDYSAVLLILGKFSIVFHFL